MILIFVSNSLKVFVFFEFCQPQGPENLKGLIIVCCIVFSGNGINFNILISRIKTKFSFLKFKFHEFSCLNAQAKSSRV